MCECVIQVWVPLHVQVLGDPHLVAYHLMGLDWLQLQGRDTREHLQRTLEIT